jgi:orotidine-5'-phosphate decarboxylase
MLEGHLEAHPGEPLAGAAEALLEFGSRVLDAVSGEVGVVKLQNAFFESAGPPGVGAFCRLIRRARDLGMVTVSDAKRSDIGSSSAAYAAAHLGALELGGAEVEAVGADAVTVNPYFGIDGVQPFIDEAARRGRGIFVLVKTSNPSGTEVQDLPAGARKVYQEVAELVRRWGEGHLGKSGYSAVGAVVGATYPEQLPGLRAQMPGAVLLIPGFGAQGGRAEDLAPAFDLQGRGAIVNSSRGIIFAYRQPRYGDLPPDRFEEAVLAATREAKAQIAAALEAR